MAPSAAKRRAAALPMPDPAPVTTTARPARPVVLLMGCSWVQGVCTIDGTSLMAERAIKAGCAIKAYDRATDVGSPQVTAGRGTG
ncbi:hypothetical protein JCM18897A_17640 [Streptomyces sp. JCM 18897]